MKYIIFSFDGIGFPVAKKLTDEDAQVTVVQIEDQIEIGKKGTEDPESKRRRLSLYDGVLEKIPLKRALAAMRSIPDKDNYFVWFDFNHLWKVSEEVEKMGFTKGLFVREEDLTYEDDREKAKELVLKEYDHVKVGEVVEFSKAKEGIDFLNDTDDVWALKGNDEGAKTKVPRDNDPEKAKRVLIDLLESHAKEYEKGGFILEQKIINGYEITPQLIFWDGVPVYASVDIENKPKGAGNEGIQLGCAQNLIVRIELTDKLTEIAFPEYVYKQAKDRKGIYVWDCGLLYKDGDFYFTEFCAQRFGYDSLFTEMAMAGGASNYFEKIAAGRNPLMYTFGAAVRGLNEHKDDEERRVLEGVEMYWDEHVNPNTWIYELKIEEGKHVTTGSGWDLVVFTGAADSAEEAIYTAYAAEKCFTFDDLMVRPEFDFLSRDYQSSIANRFNVFNHEYFHAPDLIENEHTLYMMKLRGIIDKHETTT